MEENIIVSINCLVYNQAPYLRQCLDGFVMQKTNFKFEAIIHDDASTDGSAAIIREYAERYPDIIKPIFETENQYSKHDCSLNRIMEAHLRGKYIAFCEGDDYWTDPCKLQKQFDFMETHPEYSLCFHNAIVHYEDGDKKDRLFAELEDRDYSRQELTKRWLAPTASFFFRSTVLQSKFYIRSLQIRHPIIGDLPLIISASYCGKIYGFSNVMSIYRKHNSGIMNTFRNHHVELCLQFIELKKNFGKDLRPTFNRIIASYSVLGISDILHKNFLRGAKSFVAAFVNSPIESVKLIFYYYRKRK